MKERKRVVVVRNFSGAIEEVVACLEGERPIIFSWHWLRKKVWRVIRYFDGNILKEGKTDRERVIAALPKKWRRCFADDVFCGIIQDLFDLLEEKNPEIFSKVWIIKNHKNLYKMIVAHVRAGDAVDWKRVLFALPKKWQKRWKGDDFVFRQLVADLLKLVKEKQPEFLTKEWIGENDRALYKRIVRNVRANGKPDWQRIILALPEKWQGRWLVGFRKDKLAVKLKIIYREYFSEQETWEALGADKENLYVLVAVMTREEVLIRDRIIDSLIKLSQNGNAHARGLLLSFLESKCSEWVIFGKLSSYEMFYQDMLVKINSCIDNFNFSIRFIAYLHVCLKKQAGSFSVPLRLDMDLGWRSGTYHDIYTSEEED